MAIEQELKKTNPLHKEFQSLLDEDFKDRKLKENEIIKATVTEITKNYIVVDCKAKMEGMIPVDEFKNDDELSKLKVGSTIDVYLERIESFKGEIVISRDKARKMKAWKKMEKVFESKEELRSVITDGSDFWGDHILLQLLQKKLEVNIIILNSDNRFPNVSGMFV